MVNMVPWRNGQLPPGPMAFGSTMMTCKIRRCRSCQPIPSAGVISRGARTHRWPWFANVDTNGYNLAYKDPLTWGPDSWDFPTNQLSIGRLDRPRPSRHAVADGGSQVHEHPRLFRGSGHMAFKTSAPTPGPTGRATCCRIISPANILTPHNSSPVQDQLLFDIFTTRFNDNAVRGTLPINQTSLAAWSALFSGMVVLTNTTTDQQFPQGAGMTYSATNINPAGVWTARCQFCSRNRQLVNGPYGINATRANTNVFPLQAFTQVGDILQTPALSEQSPFLNWNDRFQQQLRHQRRDV